jgi:hypothetical protein
MNYKNTVKKLHGKARKAPDINFCTNQWLKHTTKAAKYLTLTEEIKSCGTKIKYPRKTITVHM